MNFTKEPIDVLREIETWLVAFLSIIPGRIGLKIRAIYFRRRLGSCGKAPTIAVGVRLVSPRKLHLGDRVSLGHGAVITAGGGVRLGNCVGIGPDAKVWSVNHIYKDPEVPWRDQGWEHKEVVIDADAWIGAASFIMPGVHIGRGAIISAGTVLSKSVPAYSIVAGNPGRVVGWRKKPEGAAEAPTTQSDSETA